MSATKYTEEHEWIRVEGTTGTVGISDYAQKALGDVVYVELPQKGDTFTKGDEVAVVESVKAASEVYAPVTGEITETNGALDDDPSLVNSSPDEEGWFFKIEIGDEGELNDLMDEDAYAEFIKDLDD